MIKDTLIAISLLTNVSFSTVGGVISGAQFVQQEQILAKKELNLTNRIPNSTYGNRVFADNILLNLHYIKGDVEELKILKRELEILNQVFDREVLDSEARTRRAQTESVQDDNHGFRAINGPQNINWEKVREPFEMSLYLQPNEVFAYHENILPEYKNLVTVTSNSHFNYADGYKSLNGLSGNGVCHLASLINWAARDAGLESASFVNHNFAPIPDVPKEYGASIYYSPDKGRNTERQNLYIRNNFEVPVRFEFKSDNKKVILTIIK